jgi:hypothetical protein
MSKYGTAYASKPMVEEDYASDVQQPKKKRQGWIKRLLSRSRDDEGVNMSNLTVSPSRLERGEPQIDQPERAIQFTVYNANGGRVVETRRYDRQKDRNQTGLYIITSDQDFGHEIDKIITMEALR